MVFATKTMGGATSTALSSSEWVSWVKSGGGGGVRCLEKTNIFIFHFLVFCLIIIIIEIINVQFYPSINLSI